MNTMKATINLRILSAVAIAASKTEMQYYLKGVFVEVFADHTIYTATDGHRLIAVRDDVPEGPKGVNAQGKPTQFEKELNTLLGAWIIPTDVCKAFKPRKHRKHQTLAWETAELTIDQAAVSEGDVPTLRFGSCNGVQVFKPIDGSFPDWRRAIPKEVSGALHDGGKNGITFNPAYIAMFGEFAKVMNISAVPALAYNDGNPTPVIFAGHDNVLAVVMPIRADSQSELAAQFQARRKAFGMSYDLPEETAQAA